METNATPDTFPGYLYDEARTVKDDAANIRRTIKTLTKGGLLPADWTYSVRYRTASMMRAIDIRATAPRAIYAADPMSRGLVEHAETGEMVSAWVDKLTIEAGAVRATLTELIEAHDCVRDRGAFSRPLHKFYGDVTVAGAA